MKPNPKAFSTLRDACNMQAALGYLIAAHVETSEAKLPGDMASGVQTLHWHVGDTLAQAHWQLAPERQKGPPGVHTHGTEQDSLAALAHLMVTALQKDVADCDPADEIGRGLSLLTDHFTRLVEAERLKDSEKRRACWMLLQRIAAGEDVEGADFEAVGIKPAKGGAR